MYKDNVFDLCPCISDESLEGMAVHHLLQQIVILRAIAVRSPEKLMQDAEFISEARKELAWIEFRLMIHDKEQKDLAELAARGKTN